MNDLSEIEIDNFNNYFKKASDRFTPYILLENHFHNYVGFFIKLKIKKSIREFNKCLEIIPNHLNSIFFLGKCYQSLGENYKALQWFEKGLKIEFSQLTHNQDLALYYRMKNYCLLEASVIYSRTGKIEMAIEAGNKLLEYDCDNINVLTNQALNFIILNNDPEASLLVESALVINPDDLISQKIRTFLINLKSRKVVRPKKWDEFTIDK